MQPSEPSDACDATPEEGENRRSHHFPNGSVGMVGGGRDQLQSLCRNTHNTQVESFKEVFKVKGRVEFRVHLSDWTM